MAKNEPNKPDDKNVSPANEAVTEQTAPGDVVIPADKINELANKRKATTKTAEQTTESKQAQEGGKSGQDKKPPETPAPAKGAEDKAKPPKPDKADDSQKKNPPAKKKAEEKIKPFPTQKKTEEKKTREARPPKGPPVKEDTPPKEPKVETPTVPVEAPRSGEKEEIVFIKLNELFPFKDHPFGVRDDTEMRAMVESVKDKGVTQPAIVRPRVDGGYELVSGHRRQKASELAGYLDMPCIVRNLTDEQAITQMVEDNTNQRESILPSERAKALKMQLDAIKRQGARGDLGAEVKAGNGQRSNEIVAERNKMNVKQVQRFIKLNDLVPDLLKMVDEQMLKFTPAVEIAFISKKNQQYIAVAVESQQSSPNLSQAQRMRELDTKKMLNADMIDGIMLEEKKEVDKVIFIQSGT